MLNMLKRIPKKLSIPLSIFIVMIFIITIVLANLEKIVEKVSSKFINGRVTIENIDLSISKAVIKNIVLYDDKNNVLFNSPEVTTDFSFKNLIRGRIDELNIKSPIVNVVRDKNGVINFTKLVKTKSDKESKNPINKLIVSDAKVNYEDYTFPLKLERKIDNIDAIITANEKKLVEKADINIADENIHLKTLFEDKSDTKLDSLEAKLKIEKFKLDKDLLKSLANNSKLHFSDVNISSNLTLKTDKTIKNTDIVGDLDIVSEEFSYDDLETDIKDIRLSGKFNGKDGEAKLGFNIFGENKLFTLLYKDEELNSVIVFDRLDENILNKIVPLHEKKLDFKNINIENIKTIIHYSDKEGFSLKSTIKSNNSEFKGLELKDLKIYGNSKLGKNNIRAEVLTEIKGIPENLIVDLKNEKENTDINLSLMSTVKDNIVPDINIKAKLENKKDILKANIDSNIVDFNFDYNKDTKLAKIYGDKFIINYDTNKKELINGEGKVPFEIYNTSDYLDFTAKNNKIEIKELKIRDKMDKENYFLMRGNADLAKKEFEIDYVGNSFSISRKFKENNFNLSFDGKGEVKNKNGILTSEGEINDINIQYIGKIKNINGTYNFKKFQKNVEANIIGKIASIGYDKYNFKNFDFDANYSENKLKIKKFSNNSVSLKGDFDIQNKLVNANFIANRITNNDIALDKVKFVLENLRANVQGNIENLVGNINLGSTAVTLPQGDLLKITGEADIKNNLVNIKKINLDNNLITGKYSLKDKDLDIRVYLNEKHLEKYHGVKKLAYMLNGQIDIKGKAGKIKSIAKGKVFSFEKKLPDLVYDISYNAENYLDGIILINKFDIIDRKYGDLFGIKGQINLKDKTLDVKNKNKQLNLEKLQGVLENSYIKGVVNNNLSINGTLDNPSYKLNISSPEVSIKNLKLDNILLDINGNKAKIKLNKFDLEMYKNKIVGNGYYDIGSKNYNLLIKSNNKIDISKFRHFFTAYGIENAKGRLLLNVELNEKNKNAYINFENVGFESTKAKLKLLDLNGAVKFNGDNIKIDNIKASLNGSPAYIDGFVDLTNISNLNQDNLIKELPYKLHFKMDNFNYAYPDMIKLNASTEINITNEKLDGYLIIKDARVYDIPNNYYKDFFSLIREQLRKRRVDIASSKISDKKLRSDKEKAEEIKNFLNKLMPIDFTIRTKNPILIDMENFNIIVPEVYGKLDVDLNLSGKKGKYYLIGETELKEGYLFIGTNEFKVDRALAVFNENVALPEINPNIFFESRVDLDDEEYYFSTNGRVNQLRYNISSKNSKVGGDLSALIINPNADENIYSYGRGDEIFIVFMKNLIAGQVAQTIFGPTTRYIKRKFDLTKFVIRPEVKIYNSDFGINRIDGITDNKGLNPEIYNINLKLEAKDNIYKEKLFWKANVRIIGTGKDLIKNQSMKVDSKLRDYDVGLEYKVDDSKTIELGVGTVPDKYKTDENKNYKKNNYHLGFKFRKRYRDFSEIFSF